MRRLESIEDDMRGIVRYELADGRHVALDARIVREVGVHAALERAGVNILRPAGRLPVVWMGKIAGTLPADFDPFVMKSRTFLYDPRPGDIQGGDGCWMASRTLGPGDLDAIVGFEGARNERP